MMTISDEGHVDERMVSMMIQIAIGEPGELVWAMHFNGLEDPGTRGKLRPVVLVAQEDGQWLVMGLTSKDRYRDGTPRVAVPNPRHVGLQSSGYLWGSRMDRISAIDLDTHIGWVDDALAEAVIEQAGLYGRYASALRDSAQAH